MNTHQGVLQVFRQCFNDPEIQIHPNMRTGDLRGWDSFKNIEILLACEVMFGIRYRSKEIDKIRTLGDLIAMSQKKRDELDLAS